MKQTTKQKLVGAAIIASSILTIGTNAFAFDVIMGPGIPETNLRYGPGGDYDDDTNNTLELSQQNDNGNSIVNKVSENTTIEEIGAEIQNPENIQTNQNYQESFNSVEDYNSNSITDEPKTKQPNDNDINMENWKEICTCHKGSGNTDNSSTSVSAQNENKKSANTTVTKTESERKLPKTGY